MRGIHLAAVASYLPKQKVSNTQLALTVDTTDEWIVKRTGIHTRRIADQSEHSMFMAKEVGQSLIVNADLSSYAFGLLIVATATPWLCMPYNASSVHLALGLADDVSTCDVNSACSGFVQALSMASDFARLHQRSVMVIGSEAMSQLVNWEDRSTCVLFGDGAGGVVVSPSHQPCYHVGGTRSQFNHALYTTPGCLLHERSYLTMQGKEVFKLAIDCLESMVVQLCLKANISAEELKVVIPHQANSRIIDFVKDKLSMRDDQWCLTVDQHANTSSASVPLALNEYLTHNRLNEGDWVMLCAFGAGFSWSGMLFQHG